MISSPGPSKDGHRPPVVKGPAGWRGGPSTARAAGSPPAPTPTGWRGAPLLHGQRDLRQLRLGDGSAELSEGGVAGDGHQHARKVQRTLDDEGVTFLVRSPRVARSLGAAKADLGEQGRTGSNA